MNDRLRELRQSGGANAVASDDVAIDIKGGGGGGGGAFAQPTFMTEFFTDVETVKVSVCLGWMQQMKKKDGDRYVRMMLNNDASLLLEICRRILMPSKKPSRR